MSKSFQIPNVWCCAKVAENMNMIEHVISSVFVAGALLCVVGGIEVVFSWQAQGIVRLRCLVEAMSDKCNKKGDEQGDKWETNVKSSGQARPKRQVEQSRPRQVGDKTRRRQAGRQVEKSSGQ